MWKEMSHRIFGDWCKEVWNLIRGAPREVDCGHMLMWLCKMVYVEIILGREMNRSTIPYTNVELKVTLCYWDIPSVVLGHNGNCPPLLT